jgi:ankyrin repeat protein
MTFARFVFWSTLVLALVFAAKNVQLNQNKVSPRSASCEPDRSYLIHEPEVTKSQEALAMMNSEGFANILMAESSQDTFIVRKMEQGFHPADVNQFRDEEGNTLLMLAIKRNFFEVTMELLSLDADPRLTNLAGQNAVHLAATEDDPLLLRAVLSEVGKEDDALIARDQFGNTPLIEAVINGQGANISILFNHSKKVRQAIDDHGENGATALVVATMNNDYSLMSHLLNHGADPTVRDHSGNSAISYALEAENLDLIRILYNKARREVIRQEARAKSALSNAIMSNNIQWLVFLIRDLKVDLNREEFVPEFETPMLPLFLAVSIDSEHLTRYLLGHGAHLDAVDLNGNTPLMVATRNGFVSVVNCLLEYAANAEI